MSRIKLLDIAVDNVTNEELIRQLKQGVVVTPNMDELYITRHNEAYLHVIQAADWVVVDSQILRRYLKLRGTPVKELVNGVDFFLKFRTYHAQQHDMTMFLMGGRSGSAAKAAAKINREAGWQMVVGYDCPPFGFENKKAYNEQLLAKINASGADVLVIGLSNPKQSLWYEAHKDKLQTKIALCLGATIDFEAGNIKRAPVLMRKAGLEWLYRIYTEPRRLLPRYLKDATLFKPLAKDLVKSYYQRITRS